MAITYNNNSLVSTDLVSSLDAANYKSYIGSGSLWNDLSGLGNNSTLFGGCSYSSNQRGSITFNGTTGYADIPVTPILSVGTITVEGFIKWESGNGGMFFGMSGYDVWTSSNTLGYNNGASNVIGIPSTQVSNLGLIGNYAHYVFVLNNSGLLSNNSIYINTVKQSMSAVVGSDGNCQAFNNNLRLASWNGGGFYGNITISNLRIYSRRLSVAEIQRNFNALRGRYGL